MSNVIPFASKKQQLQKRLLATIRDLQEIYGNLDTVTSGVATLENIAQDIEEDYNMILRKYVDEVGVENVELGFLEYTTDIEVYFKNGSIDLKYTYNPKQLTLFPDGE